MAKAAASRWAADKQELVVETKQLVFKDWNNNSHYSDYEAREEFVLLGHKWCIQFKPISSEYEDLKEGYASILLTNLSTTDAITACYHLTMKNQQGIKPDVSFTDPEKLVKFDISGCGDDSWGTEEFILTEWIQDESHGFIENDSVLLEVTIQRYASCSKSKDTLLMKAIEESREEEDLLAIADQDIEPFRLKYDVSTAAKLTQQENSLVELRNYEMYKAGAGSSHNNMRERKGSTTEIASGGRK